MKKFFVIIAVVFLLTQGLAFAQVAPPPKASPRIPVNQETLPEHKPSPSSRTVEGQATIIDAEKLRVADVDLRLFGIVPPQLSASFGPQARATLDNLVTGQSVSCMIHDRDHDGRFLATCRTGNSDLALELVKRGLAITARGSLGSTDLAQPYLAAEQAAQSQKLGLWSTNVPPAASISAVPAKTEAAKVEPALVLPPPPAPTPVVEANKAEAKPAQDAAPVKVPASTIAASIAASQLAPPDDETLAVPETNFLVRYQLLITGLIMLVTALSILTVVSIQRRNEHRDEMKAIAAALRGELMAARAVCQARLKTLLTDADEKNTTWPRIRATLYQAYVGRLGFLGAELARQIASIYGQSSDYAAFYNGDETRAETTPKKQALQTLVQYIEEVLPKLALIEQTGQVMNAPVAMSVRPQTLSLRATTPSVVSPQTVVAAPPVEPSPVASSPAPAAAKATPEIPSDAVKSAVAGLSTTPLWDSLRQLRERFAEKKTGVSEEGDYASIIEAEMTEMSFGESDDETETPITPDNVTKFRETGS
jgi:endonuclease YncB( thermonuclease family)